MSTTLEASDASERAAKLEALGWLADVPLFIDESRVERFFNAVVGPKYYAMKLVEQASTPRVNELKGALDMSAEAELKVPLPAFLGSLFGKGIKAGAELKGAAAHSSKTESNTRREFASISSAERMLEELTLYYLLYHRDRVLLVDDTLEGTEKAKGPWYRSDILKGVPRALAFLDLKPKTKFIPTAAEFENGQIVLLYQELLAALTGELGGPMEQYPDDMNKSEEILRADRKAYWASYDKWFNPRIGMQIIERAASRCGRISWIDFRLPLSEEGDTLHMHICPAGRCAAGDFGYYLVTRGFKHGLRVVGTLKSEPDMNVLAIYEK